MSLTGLAQIARTWPSVSPGNPYRKSELWPHDLGQPCAICLNQEMAISLEDSILERMGAAMRESNESLISAILISIDEKRRSADVGRGGVTLPPLPK